MEESGLMKKTLLLVAVLALFAPNVVQAKCFPVYGNWCGAAYPPPGTNPPPVDIYDAACRRHDLCYSSPTPQGACDAAFGQELRVLAARTGYLPRPLQWAESMLRFKDSGNPFAMPMPGPGDMMGVMGMLGADCGY